MKLTSHGYFYRGAAIFNPFNTFKKKQPTLHSIFLDITRLVQCAQIRIE